MPLALQGKGDFIDGSFVLPETPDGFIDLPSPADLDDRVGAFPFAASQVERAVAAARRAQPAWERLALEQRCSFVRRLGEELQRRAEPLAELLAREIGKPLWEARTEVSAVLAKIGITLDEGLGLVRGFELEGGRLSCRFRPHGVLGVIGPFNFPIHLPHGHIVPALVTGNTVVFKPSEVAPACAQLYAEAVRATGFPAGVLNIVQGLGPSGAALSSHPDIDGLLFTGSYETGCRIIRANADRPGRMLALELGGKNSAIVLADAPWEKTLHDLVFSAFVTAGQRCTAVSRIVVERAIADRFTQEFVDHAARLTVGQPRDPRTFLGPITTRAGFEKFQTAQELALQEQTEVLLPSRMPESGARGYYATPSVHRIHRPNAASAYQTAEIFGPDVGIYAADDLEEACAMANATPYGLAAGVFTANAKQFDACAARLRTGCLTWNNPTVGSSSRLPFGGLKNSGNHRPAGVFSTLYCTYPQAVTRGADTLDQTKTAPGMNWVGS